MGGGYLILIYSSRVSAHGFVVWYASSMDGEIILVEGLSSGFPGVKLSFHMLLVLDDQDFSNGFAVRSGELRDWGQPILV